MLLFVFLLKNKITLNEKEKKNELRFKLYAQSSMLYVLSLRFQVLNPNPELRP